MTQKQVNYTGPFIIMVILFFFVGFFTNINQQFQEPLKEALLADAGSIQNTLMTLITLSWFLSYPAFGGVGNSWVTKYGYKGTLVRALLFMVCGLAVFEASVLMQIYSPSAIKIGSSQVPVAFFVFILGSFLVGGAVTIMQVVINPFLINCEVKGTSDVQRQSIGGASNSLATTVGPLFVAFVIFGGEKGHIDNLVIPFIVLGVVIFTLAMIVNRLNLPTIASAVATKDEKLERSIWSFRHLALGVIAIFFYVGVEVAVGTNIISYARELGGSFAENAARMSALYWGGMLVGRLVGSVVSNVSARVQLLATSIGALVLLLAATLLNNPWILVGVGICHSIMWPAIFSLAVYKLGKYSSIGSSALMIGVVGGGVLPFVQGVLADTMGSWEPTWILVILGELFLIYYAFIGSKPAAKDIQE